MSNPLQRLSRLPWISLLIAAILTNIWVFVLEFFLWFGAARFSSIQTVINLLFSPPLGMVMAVAIGTGVGALAVYLLEIVYPQLIIDTGVLWALVPCLLIAIAIKVMTLQSLLLPNSLVSLNETQFLGLILGIFLKGKPYWRR
ncbi:MAG TPA: peptide chain release factor 1 [Coleofasciculaceae cyanobacterium]